MVFSVVTRVVVTQAGRVSEMDDHAPDEENIFRSHDFSEMRPLESHSNSSEMPRTGGYEKLLVPNLEVDPCRKCASRYGSGRC